MADQAPLLTVHGLVRLVARKQYRSTVIFRQRHSTLTTIVLSYKISKHTFSSSLITDRKAILWIPVFSIRTQHYFTDRIFFSLKLVDGKRPINLQEFYVASIPRAKGNNELYRAFLSLSPIQETRIGLQIKVE